MANPKDPDFFDKMCDIVNSYNRTVALARDMGQKNMRTVVEAEMKDAKPAPQESNADSLPDAVNACATLSGRREESEQSEATK